MVSAPRKPAMFLILIAVALASFVIGFAWSAKAAEPSAQPTPRVRTVYPKDSTLDFEGLKLEGELKNPAEFYFQSRPQEKFDSLVKRRTEFHRQMLRDGVWSK